jgi:hypothetical protein
MRRLFIFCSVALLLLSVIGRAWSRETEHLGHGEFPNQENYQHWPGIMRLINHQSRIYHRWRDGHEDFYYSSDSATLNAALLRFAVIEAKYHVVVLAPGPQEVRTLSKKTIIANWSLHLVGGTARRAVTQEGREGPSPVLTIYVGEDVELDALKIPNSLTVISEDELKKRDAKTSIAKSSPARSSPQPPQSRGENKKPNRLEPKKIEQASDAVASAEATDSSSAERQKQRLEIQAYVDARRKK